MEHKLIFGGEKYLAFARSRIKAMRATGMGYASQQFILSDAEIHVRITPEHSFIRIVGKGDAGLTGWRWGTVSLANLNSLQEVKDKLYAVAEHTPAPDRATMSMLSYDGSAAITTGGGVGQGKIRFVKWKEGEDGAPGEEEVKLELPGDYVLGPTGLIATKSGNYFGAGGWTMSVGRTLCVDIYDDSDRKLYWMDPEGEVHIFDYPKNTTPATDVNEGYGSDYTFFSSGTSSFVTERDDLSGSSSTNYVDPNGWYTEQTTAETYITHTENVYWPNGDLLRIDHYYTTDNTHTIQWARHHGTTYNVNAGYAVCSDRRVFFPLVRARVDYERANYTSTTDHIYERAELKVLKQKVDPQGNKSVEEMSIPLDDFHLSDIVHTTIQSVEYPLAIWNAPTREVHGKIIGPIICPNSDGKRCRVLWGVVSKPNPAIATATFECWLIDVTASGEVKNKTMLFRAGGTFGAIGFNYGSMQTSIDPSFAAAAPALTQNFARLVGITHDKYTIICSLGVDAGESNSVGNYLGPSGSFVLEFTPAGDTTPAKAKVRSAYIAESAGVRIDGTIMRSGLASAGAVQSYLLPRENADETTLRAVSTLTLDAPNNINGVVIMKSKTRKKK